jgi:hypothetical protein
MASVISKTSRRELMAVTGERYRASAAADRLRILTEFVAVTGYHRKHAIRVLNGDPHAVSLKRGGRLRVYDDAVREALVVLWAKDFDRN